MTTSTTLLNKDLILREKLALQRTVLANQTTLLAFFRTALYFLVAALSLRSLLKVENSFFIELSLFTASFAILIFGIFNFYKHKKRIQQSEKHIGDYKLEHQNH